MNNFGAQGRERGAEENLVGKLKRDETAIKPLTDQQ